MGCVLARCSIGDVGDTQGDFTRDTKGTILSMLSLGRFLAQLVSSTLI